jgi:ribosomal protein S18 acetylase RimI-like enzyme
MKGTSPRTAFSEEIKGDEPGARMGTERTRIRTSLASHRDAEKFLKLEALCFEMEPNRDTVYFWTPVVEYLWTYKAEIGSRIVGGMIAMPNRHGGWYVNSLFVHPKFRNRGIASLLLKRFLSRVKGCKVMLDVKTDRPHLLAFYGKFGFVRKAVLPNYYRDGTDRFLLVRKARIGPDQ